MNSKRGMGCASYRVVLIDSLSRSLRMSVITPREGRLGQLHEDLFEHRLRRIVSEWQGEWQGELCIVTKQMPKCVRSKRKRRQKAYVQNENEGFRLKHRLANV